MNKISVRHMELMELHTTTELTDQTSIMRVPGGWIYIFYSGRTIVSTSFVPVTAYGGV